MSANGTRQAATKPLDPDALRKAFAELRDRVSALEASVPDMAGFPAASRFNPPKRPRTREELEAVMMGNGATKEEAERDARRICEHRSVGEQFPHLLR